MKSKVAHRTKMGKDKAKKIVGLILLIASVACFVCCIFPSFLNIGHFFQGVFGVVAYPLFLLTFLVGIALVLNMNYTFDKKFTAYIVVSFVCLLGLAHTIFCSKALMNEYTKLNQFKGFIKYCYSMKGGITVGGVILAALVYLVRCLVNVGGTYVFFAVFATVFIGLVIDYAIYSKGKNKRKQALEEKPSFRRMNNQEIPEDQDELYSFSTKKTEAPKSFFDQEEVQSIDSFDSQENQSVGNNVLFETNDQKTEQLLDTSRDIEFSFNAQESKIETIEDQNRQRAKSTLFGTAFGQGFSQEQEPYIPVKKQEEPKEEVSQEPKSAREVLFGSAPQVPNIFDRSSEERDAWRRQYATPQFNQPVEEPGSSNPFDNNFQKDFDEQNNKSLFGKQDNDSEVVKTSWGTYRPTPPVNRLTPQTPIDNFAAPEQNDNLSSQSFNAEQNYNNSGLGFNSNIRERNSSQNLFGQQNQNLNRESTLNNRPNRNIPRTTISNLNQQPEQEEQNDNFDFGSRVVRNERIRRGSDLLADASSLGSLGIDTSSKDNDFVSIAQNQREIRREESKEPEKPKVVEKISFADQLNTKYNAPPTTILNITKEEKVDYSQEYREKTAIIENTLSNFKIPAKVNNVVRGPKVTRYELAMPLGIPVSRVLSYEKDLSMGLATRSGVRIEAPIPGKNAFGIEVENAKPSMVGFRELVESNEFKTFKHPLPVAIGKNISGEIIVKSLGRMVHCLVAGSTGSGKSVFLHSLIVSLMYRHSPEELRFIMIDPKRVEFSRYNRMPHLMLPEVVTECSKAVNSLTWAVKEMERRYELLRVNDCQKLEQFNECQAVKEGREKKLPYLVIVVDELAELMSVAAKEAESKIQRITQLGRAAGIHMVIATQRPSVDVVTGVIKNNLPTRIAFALASAVDSQTIINQGGAEKLLGQGDMLLSAQDSNAIVRLQAAFVSDEEIKKVLTYIKANNVSVYDEEIQKSIYAEPEPEPDKMGDDDKPAYVSPEDRMDEHLPQALKLVMKTGKASISMIQRRFGVGYARAARIIDQMEVRGYIDSGIGNKPRDVKITIAEYNELFGDFDAE